MATLLETDIAHLSENIAQQYAIPAQYFEDQSIKRGLRNADGTGVLIGVSKVGSVQGYYMMDGERVPMPGKLYYRGISVEDIVEAHRKSGTFGYEEVAYLLLLGSLPTQAQQQQLAAQCTALLQSCWQQGVDALHLQARATLRDGSSASFDPIKNACPQLRTDVHFMLY